MKICIAADIHLPYDRRAPQYDAFSFMLEDAFRKKADAFVFAGDITAAGDSFAAEAFYEKMKRTEKPFFAISGNSDLRGDDKNVIHCADTVTEVGGIKLIMLADGAASLSEGELDALEKADENTLVFMHHPKENLHEPWRSRFFDWRAGNPGVKVHFAHIHRSFFSGADVSLPALDPDKAIGENPSFLYYDTVSGEYEKTYYFCPMITDMKKYYGISCYRPVEQLEFSALHSLASAELRPNSAESPVELLSAAVEKWRSAGGKDLSIHFPDVVPFDGEINNKEKLFSFAALANRLGADRITVHVPRMFSSEASPGLIEKLGAFYGSLFEALPENCVCGIENLHMTEKDRELNRRPYGCIPEECLEIMREAQKHTSRRVGINLDLGHARNNAPYSMKYTLGAWYAETGEYTVGYHVHQVTEANGVFDNHTPVAGHYERLISFASFYDCLSRGVLNKAPVIYEIRTEGGAEKTVSFIESETQKAVSDLHTHTYYSACGRDEPQKLVDAAVKNGISVLGICDHSYGIGSRKKEYLEEMRALKEKNRDRIKILCGIEIPSLPFVYDFNDGDFSEIADYDYCLIEHIDEPESVVGKELFSFAEKVGIPCGVAHTDMFGYCKAFGFEPSVFFAEMAKRGIFWELNMSYDSIHSFRKHGYAERFLSSDEEKAVVRDAGLRISLGSDTHRCEEYCGARLFEAYEKTADIKKAGPALIARADEKQNAAGG